MVKDAHGTGARIHCDQYERESGSDAGRVRVLRGTDKGAGLLWSPARHRSILRGWKRGWEAMRTRAQRMLNAVQRPEVYEEVLIEFSGAPVVLSVWKGNSGAPCVVFLPGTMTHPLFYEVFLDGLALAGFNVVGVHLRAHGKSPRTNKLFTFDDLVSDGLNAVTYATESFGGRYS